MRDFDTFLGNLTQDETEELLKQLLPNLTSERLLQILPDELEENDAIELALAIEAKYPEEK